MSSKRSPLKPISGNGVTKRPMRSNDAIASMTLRKVSLWSMSDCVDPPSGTVSHFDIAKDESRWKLDWSDSWWLNNFSRVTEEEDAVDICSELRKFLDMPKQTGVKYFSSHTFEGDQNYDPDELMPVPPNTFQEVLRGTDATFLSFVKTEGMLVRLMLGLNSHLLRLRAFRCWALCVARLCGPVALRHVRDALTRLGRISLMYSVCPGPSSGTLQSFRRYSTEMIQATAHWQVAFQAMDTTREEYFSSWAYSGRVCAAHLDRCACMVQLTDDAREVVRRKNPKVLQDTLSDDDLLESEPEVPYEEDAYPWSDSDIDS